MGHASQGHINITADSVHVGIVQLDVEHFLDDVVRDAGVNNGSAGFFQDYLFLLGPGKLVLNLSDDFLQQVFQGNDAFGSAIFIHHYRHLDCLLLELLQQHVQAFGFGDEVCLADQILEGCLGPVVPGKKLQQVEGVDDTDDVVDVIFEYGDTGVPALDDGFDGLGDRGIDLQGNHVQAGNHYFVGGGVVQLNYGPEHLPVVPVHADQFFFGDVQRSRVGGAVRIRPMVAISGGG